MELSIIIPCLNEAETIEICVNKARESIQKAQLEGEVIIVDNGSTDRSQGIASEAGARVIKAREKGYGNALTAGIAAAKGKYIVMSDADDSYDLSNIAPFIEKLEKGYDFVIGNRYKGGIDRGAMPMLHKYLGNPAISNFGRLLFGCPVNDFLCGLRAFSKQAVLQLEMKTTGMEFCTEMVIKATLLKMKMIEIPTTLKPDGRSGASHLNSWPDGWRNIRCILSHYPIINRAS